MRLDYRPWSGTSRAAIWSIWPIARVSLGLLVRRRLFRWLYVCAILIPLMFFFGSLFLDWAQGRLQGAETIQLGFAKIDANVAMNFVRQQLRILAGSRETYATFLGLQGPTMAIMLCLSGAVLVGNDFAQRAVAFYLAKPIKPWHYLAGKFLAIAIMINVIATLPALVIYLQQTLNDWDYLLRTDFFAARGIKGPGGVRLLLGVLACGGILTVVLGLILLTTSAYAQRTMPLILVWTSLFLFPRALSNTLVDGLRCDAGWRLIDLWNSLNLLGARCLGFGHDEIQPRPQPSYRAAALVLGGVCVLCLTLLWRRTYRLEVVRSA